MKKSKENIVIPDGCSRVLLHACCAPCSSAIVEWLLAHGVEPVIYYYNPNIYPREEYEIRKNESKRHAETLGIEWIDEDEGREASGERREGAFSYQKAHESWRDAVCGLEKEPERGRRCEKCFYVRLLKTAKKAQELGIGFFATTLASSRWKNLEQVNAAGCRAAEKARGERELKGERREEVEGREAKVQFWAQNWRKDGLQERRNQLLKEFNFYNQQYCGCEFSIKF